MIISRSRSASFGGFTVLRFNPGAWWRIGNIGAGFCSGSIDTRDLACMTIAAGENCYCSSDTGCPDDSRSTSTV